MKSETSPELDFIISVCFQDRGYPTEQNLNWEEVTRIVLGNRILGYVLTRLQADAQNDEVFKRLETLHRNQMLSSLASSGEIVKINQIASKLDIPIWFYKGQVWSEWLFGDMKVRAPGDIDLFVSSEHMFDLFGGLREAGYTANAFHQNFLQAPEPVRSAFLKSDYHIPLYKRDNSGHTLSVVEAHWKIAYPRLCFDFNPEDFAAYSTSLPFLNHEVPILTNEYQFLMMIVNHGGKEGWNRLKYVIDLKAYLDRYGTKTDWKLVFRIARQKGILKLVNESLGILRALGYHWKKEYPAVSEIRVSPFLPQWRDLKPLPENASWYYFRHALSTRDFGYKFNIITAHLGFLTDFRLHRHKLKWYRDHPGSSD